MMGITTNGNTHEIPSTSYGESALSTGHCAGVHNLRFSDEYFLELTFGMADSERASSDSSTSDDDYVPPEIPDRLYERGSNKHQRRTGGAVRETWVIGPPPRDTDSSASSVHGTAPISTCRLVPATLETCVAVTSAPGLITAETSCHERLSGNGATLETGISDRCLYVRTSTGLCPINDISDADLTVCRRESGYITLGLDQTSDNIPQDLEIQRERLSRVSIASSGRGTSLMSVVEDSDHKPQLSRFESTDSGCFEEVMYEITDTRRRPSGQDKELWTGRHAQNMRKGTDPYLDMEQDRDDYEVPFLHRESQEDLYMDVQNAHAMTEDSCVTPTGEVMIPTRSNLQRSDTELWSPEKGRELYKKFRSSTLPSTDEEMRAAKERLSRDDAGRSLPSRDGMDGPSATIHNIATSLPPIEEQLPLSTADIQTHILPARRRPVPAPRTSLKRANSTPD